MSHPSHAPPFDTSHRTHAEQVQDATAWLRLYACPGGRTYSYVAKHAAQKWAGRYVSSTALVEAARQVGYRVCEQDRSGNAYCAFAIRKTPREPAQ